MRTFRTLCLLAALLLFPMGCKAENADRIAEKETEKDNSYTCIFFKELDFDPSGEDSDSVVTCSDKGLFKYGFRMNDDAWSVELLTVSPLKDMQSIEVSTDSEHAILGAGVLPDDSGFLTVCSDIATSKTFIEIRNRTGEVTETLPLENFAETQLNMPLTVTVDEKGFVYLDDRKGYSPDDKKADFCIYSPQGKLVKRKEFEKSRVYDINILSDGRVVCDFADEITGENHLRIGAMHSVVWVNPENGEEETLYEYKEINPSTDSSVYAIGLFDDNKLVYMDEEGIFLADYLMQNSQKVFDWKAEGIEIVKPFMKQYRIFADKEGTIFLYAQYQKEFFMALKPTPESVKELKIAVPKNSKTYLKAVADFNMLYPEYKISLEEYDNDNKAALLTKVIAGEGPLLLDAGLVPFKDNKEYWEPIESIVSSENLEELNDFALKLGQIDGKLYGLTVAFGIDTIVSYEDMKDWDYNQFVEKIENDDNLNVIVGMRFFENMSEPILASYYFNAGIDDSYYLSKEDLNKVVDERKFRKMLELIRKHPADAINPEDMLEAMKAGKVLGIRESLCDGHSFCALYTIYGDDIKIVGYPRKNGAKNYIQSYGTLLVSGSATEEEKEIAGKFIKVLLSYDVQKYVVGSGNPAFSTRKDVLNEQLEATKLEEGLEFGEDNRWYRVGEIDVSKVKKDMEAILEQCMIRDDEEEEYRDIIIEETDLFFEDGISEDELINRLNKRLGLYFKEKSQ